MRPGSAYAACVPLLLTDLDNTLIDRTGAFRRWAERYVAGMRTYGSVFDDDEARWRKDAGAAFDRSFTPDGTGRQFFAVGASGSRAEGLRRLTVPTLVLHGSADTLVDPIGGRRTAERDGERPTVGAQSVHPERMSELVYKEVARSTSSPIHPTVSLSMGGCSRRPRQPSSSSWEMLIPNTYG